MGRGLQELMIMLMITFKGAISSLRCELSATHTLKWSGHKRVQITCNTSGAHHVQFVGCLMVQGDSSAVKFDRIQIAIILALIY